MNEWYILHVQIGREEKVADILKNKLSSKLYRPFIPYKEKIFRRAGVTTTFSTICFPGYVFIESNTAAKVFYDNTKRLIWSIKEILSILSYDGKENFALVESERLLLSMLLKDGDCIRVSSGIIVDGVLHVQSGALVGLENHVVKINRSRMYAEIEVAILGNIQRVGAVLQVLSSQTSL